MIQTSTVFHGVVHGKIIQLENEPGLPDGQSVTVTMQPVTADQLLPPGEGLRRSFGGWAEDANELDQFLEWNRIQRQRTRKDIGT